MKILPWVFLVLLVITTPWAFVSTRMLRSRTTQLGQTIDEADSLRKHLENTQARLMDSQRRVADLERKVQETEQRAQEIERKAQSTLAKADEMRLREEKQLHKLYPGLAKFELGTNIVNQKYLESFDSSGSVFINLRFKFTNNDVISVTPDVSVTFLNSAGAETGHASIKWAFSTVGPGETRYDEDTVHPTLGEPYYYYLEIK